jgi:FHS family L-fucose permease-like MFS transporter
METKAAQNALWATIISFFLCGFSTTLNDTLIPFLKQHLLLPYSQVMLVQLCFYFAYFSLCPLAGMFLPRWGYRLLLTRGLATGGFSCILLLWALSMDSFWLALLAIYGVGAGVALLQVGANPLALASGGRGQGPSRLSFAQSFTAMGFCIAPLTAGLFLFFQPHWGLPALYMLLGIAWLIAAYAVHRLLARAGKLSVEGGSDWLASLRPFVHKRHLQLIWLAIALYIATEVCLGSFMISLLGSPRMGGLSLDAAARLTTIYWGGLIVGRLFLARWIHGERSHLTVQWSTLSTAALIVLSALSSGYVAQASLLLTGFAQSLLFPALFSLGVREGGAPVSGILCMGNVGGALGPLLQGALADALGLQLSLLVPIGGALGVAACSLMAQHSRNLEEKPV